MTSLPMIAQTAGKGAARAEARRRARLGSGRRPTWRTYTVLTLTLVASVLPLYYTFLIASTDMPHLNRDSVPSLIPQGEFLTNLRRVLDSEQVDFSLALRNSLVIAVITSVSVVFFATLAGYSFSQFSFRGRRTLLGFIVATMAVPTQLGVVPLFMLATELGWQNKIVSVIVPGLVTAFGVFWMTQYLDSALPRELVEAARVDGCSMLRTFWSVAWPAARPAAAMLALFTFIGSWTNFFWPFIVLGSGNPTLPVAVALVKTSLTTDYPLLLAGVALTTAPLLLLFVVTGRQLVTGIMQGALKG